jgi:hypothetical protein
MPIIIKILDLWASAIRENIDTRLRVGIKNQRFSGPKSISYRLKPTYWLLLFYELGQ